MSAVDVSANWIVGICDTCLSIKEFGSDRARDLWEKFHPHEEN